MIHPHTELRFASAEKGLGVFALAAIPKGTVTWVRDPLDYVLPANIFASLPDELQEAFDHDYYRDWDGHYVLTHDHARFMNHSCRPNCAHAYVDVEIAIRDIAPGEELCNDYASLALDPREDFDCACLEASCRRRVRHDDPSSRLDFWRAVIRDALHCRLAVAQPLAFLFGASSLGKAA